MRTLNMRIVTYLIKYLSEFEFIFETILYESGDQMGSFDVKNSPSKISCLGTFNVCSWPVIVTSRSCSLETYCIQYVVLEDYT